MNRFLMIFVCMVFLASFTIVACSGESSSSPTSGNTLFENSGYSKEALTDSRDGQTYKTVIIGEQVWMAENLNYGTENSYCYDNNVANCSKYGRLYTLAAAMTACPVGWHLPSRAEWETLLTAVGGSPFAGDNLKSTSGWNEACYDIDGDSIINNYGEAISHYIGEEKDSVCFNGNGTDAFGFSALPAGLRKSKGFCYEGNEAMFWSSTEDDITFVCHGVYCDQGEGLFYALDLVRDSRGLPLQYNYIRSFSMEEAYSVRCLQNSKKENASSSSSIAQSSSSQVALASPCKTDQMDTCVYGEFLDVRDSKTYKTVLIGSQTWMAENLNYEMENSLCYSSDTNNCAKYGRFYEWAAATMACPSGWHLPTKTELETLIESVGGSLTAGKAIRSISGWNANSNGSDDFGFAAFPAGGWFGIFDSQGDEADFWSVSEYDDDDAYYMFLFSGSQGQIATLSHFSKGYGASVRCLKDAP